MGAGFSGEGLKCFYGPAVWCNIRAHKAYWSSKAVESSSILMVAIFYQARCQVCDFELGIKKADRCARSAFLGNSFPVWGEN
jgi:hypothetical protein